jgi:hypothetical protein
MRGNGADGVARAGQVDVDRVLPVRIFPVEDRLERLDAGIREQDVEPAKGGARRLGRGAQSRKIALIETRFAPACAGGFDQTSRLRKILGRRGRHLERRTDRSGNVDAHHVGALAGEGDRRRPPDPARRSGHDGGLAAQSA